MKFAVGVVNVLFVALLLLMSTTILGDRYKGTFAPPGSYPYGAGNATEGVRAEVVDSLSLFQDGYIGRDPELLEPFMDRLFSSANTTILGTMPREIYVGFDRATELVREDWRSWGDCRFDLENVQISSAGGVSWFATVGFVEFDLSRLLVLPLRLSGVMVSEDGTWRFQQLQFQFDLDLSLLILINLLLGIWLAVQLIVLVVIAIRCFRQRSRHGPDLAG